jgi:hypothetical protein
MSWKSTVLIAAAVLTLGAAKKPATPKPPAAKPVAAVAFDAREPESLITLLASLDAKAEVTRRDAENVMIKVASPAGDFQAQFGGCNAQGRGCGALQFEASSDQRTATLAEINGFNQSSLTCRLFQDRSNRPHVLYSTLLFPAQTREQTLTHVAAWRGCLASFGDFLKDPAGYLAVAP